PQEAFALPRPGELVQVIPLGQTGVLLDDPAQMNRVRVQVGPIQVTVGVEELRPHPTGPTRRAQEPRSGRGTSARAQKPSSAPVSHPAELPEEAGAGLQVPTSENSCDLRGLRADEALDRAEEFMDQAMLNHSPYIYLIHGHGTGALKRSLRSYLGSSPYVRRFRPGQPDEGGDGVTVVELQV
ncbi:MAG: Smr/MutS family protein, partial [Candidatus Tectomicrobia bacterium]|nr:Smr/MutS family protein [Candidatus Tectomicrobia bacterium]